MILTPLSDDELISSLQGLCFDSRRREARIVLALAEVEQRRLHLKAACGSLFDFCVRRLLMSEGTAEGVKDRGGYRPSRNRIQSS